MLDFQINLNRRDNVFCSPTILVSDDKDQKYPIISPEDMTIEEAMSWLRSVLPVMYSHQTIESLSEYF